MNLPSCFKDSMLLTASSIELDVPKDVSGTLSPAFPSIFSKVFLSLSQALQSMMATFIGRTKLLPTSLSSFSFNFEEVSCTFCCLLLPFFALYKIKKNTAELSLAVIYEHQFVFFFKVNLYDSKNCAFIS